jgi:hypothetical protein
MFLWWAAVGLGIFCLEARGTESNRREDGCGRENVLDDARRAGLRRPQGRFLRLLMDQTLCEVDHN